MTELKLARLPDRTPVKIGITVSPDLNRGLQAYVEIYRETYGDSEPIADLIPFMLEAFLENDRGFAKARRERETQALPAVRAAAQGVRKRNREQTDALASTRGEK